MTRTVQTTAPRPCEADAATAPAAATPRWRRLLSRTLMLAFVATATVPNSGCMILWEAAEVLTVGGGFFWGTPIIPVTPYLSQKVEDTYWEEERYGSVPILDPVEGENAPIFCQDPPSPDEIVRAIPGDPSGGVPFLAETQWNNMEVIVEPIVDRLDDCRFYPMAGPCRQHHCHYKCTVYYDETLRSSWPVPFSHTDRSQEVVYIDKNYLYRCAGPVVSGP